MVSKLLVALIVITNSAFFWQEFLQLEDMKTQTVWCQNAVSLHDQAWASNSKWHEMVRSLKFFFAVVFLFSIHVESKRMNKNRSRMCIRILKTFLQLDFSWRFIDFWLIEIKHSNQSHRPNIKTPFAFITTMMPIAQLKRILLLENWLSVENNAIIRLSPRLSNTTARLRRLCSAPAHSLRLALYLKVQKINRVWG